MNHYKLSVDLLRTNNPTEVMVVQPKTTANTNLCVMAMDQKPRTKPSIDNTKVIAEILALSFTFLPNEAL